QYLEGLRRLGHEVYYIEDTDSWPYDPTRDASSPDCSHAVDYIARAMQWAGLSDRWAYRAAEPDGRIYGLSESRFAQVFEQADALINWAASTRLREEHLAVPIRILLETDPGGGEILAAQGDPETVKLLSTHTHFFNWGENLGAPDCKLPVQQFAFQPTRMPVVLDWFTMPNSFFSNGGGPPPLRFTTIANWYQPGTIVWNGEIYSWSKHPQFLRFVDLPRRVGQAIELALGSIDEESTQLLISHGWRVIDASCVGTD